MYLPFAIMHLTPFFLHQNFALHSHQSSLMYANVPTVSAHKTSEQLQATGQGQFC